MRTSSASHYDNNADTCAVCHDTGKLLCCDFCNFAYHLDCAGINIVPLDSWKCPQCKVKDAKSQSLANIDDTDIDGFVRAFNIDDSEKSYCERLVMKEKESVQCDGFTFLLFPPLRPAEEVAAAKQSASPSPSPLPTLAAQSPSAGGLSSEAQSADPSPPPLVASSS